mgnify:FL=1
MFEVLYAKAFPLTSPIEPFVQDFYHLIFKLLQHGVIVSYSIVSVMSYQDDFGLLEYFVCRKFVPH